MSDPVVSRRSPVRESRTTRPSFGAAEMWRAYCETRLDPLGGIQQARTVFTEERRVGVWNPVWAPGGGSLFYVLGIAWNDPVAARWRRRESWLIDPDSVRQIDLKYGEGDRFLMVMANTPAPEWRRPAAGYPSDWSWVPRYAWAYRPGVLTRKELGGRWFWNWTASAVRGLGGDVHTLYPRPWERLVKGGYWC